MRPYRGMTKEGTRVEGGCYEDEKRSYIIVDVTKYMGSIFAKAVEVIPETVGRQIGRKDRNGKEVCIGDIYIYQQPLVKDGKQIYKEHRVEVKDDIVELYYLSNRAESGKGIYIIGNIHEKPELLK